MKIAIAQVNFMLGDLMGNVDKLIDVAERAALHGADLVVTPELALCGYPPEDLLFRHDFRHACAEALARLCARLAANPLTNDMAMVVGHPHVVASDDSSPPGYVGERRERLFNAASLIRHGRVVHTYLKQRLPNYQVFDEKRYFETGHKPFVFELDGVKVGVLICEDVWYAAPVAATARAGADIIVVPNASPFDMNKLETRYDVVRARVAEAGLPILYAHWIGGQDELIFDGASFGVNKDGSVGYQEREFEEALGIIDFSNGIISGAIHPTLPMVASVYRALVVALRDYVDKNGFPGVLLGLSGGVDSALTLAIAVDALGAGRVEAVMMPSEYTAQISLDDARELAAIHGVKYSEIPITAMFETFKFALKNAFAGRQPDTSEENIQARVRGTLLMALSNKFGAMVVTTGNKSEMAVGYSTLYGDMAGGYAILKDVSKTLVYQLCHWRNQQSDVIPERVITRPPSAELRADQKDQDSLPDYAILDQIVELFMEQDRAPSEIVALGFLDADVKRVTRLLKINEYKRRQSPVGAKITRRGFGKDWRYPITSKYWPQ